MSQVETKAVSSTEDVLLAMDFAMDYFNRVFQDRELSRREYEELMAYYHDQRDRARDHRPTDEVTVRPRDVCWSCRGRTQTRDNFCPSCGAPVQGERVDRLRHLVFLAFEIKKHEKMGRLRLSSSHAFLTEANERIAALRRKLDKERVPVAIPGDRPIPVLEAAPEAPPTPPPSHDVPKRESRHERHAHEGSTHRKQSAPQRSILEIMLDPRSIQWLLASGGALLALGLLIWLATKGIFEDKIFVASLLGAGSVALLAAGWALMLGTRYQLAGRALTLLGCLVLPLNLWFYDHQHLLRFENGDPLWIPALFCCLLYALSARVLRDATFVPVLVLGLTATALLFLADRQVHKFWEIAAPATLLVGIGVVCIHVERAFPEADSPFGRRRFGLAFFWSGHVVLAGGLLLLLGAQISGGWLYHSVFQRLHPDFNPPDVVDKQWGKLLALGLVLAGTYAYLYSDLVVRRVGVYLTIAVFTLLWAEVLLINLLMVESSLDVVILALALTALVVNLVIVSSRTSLRGEADPAKAERSVLFRAGAPLGLILSAIPVIIGVVRHLVTVAAGPQDPLHHVTQNYVGVMVVTAITCRIGAYLYRHLKPALSVVYFFGTAAATLVAADALLMVSWPDSRWPNQAPMLALIPIAYLVAAALYRGHTAEKPLVWVGHTAMGVMLFISVAYVYGLLLLQGMNGKAELLLWSPLLALFFAEAAVFYVLAASLHRHSGSVYLATVMGCVAVWLLLYTWGKPAEYYVLAFAGVGLVLLVGYRLAVLDRYGEGPARAAFGCANTLLSLSFVGAALMTLSELATEKADRQILLWLLPTLVFINLLAIMLVRQRDWRRWYVVSLVINAALTVVVLVTLSHLTAGQRLEVVCLVIGAGMLLSAHIGWFREQDRHNDLVSLGLFFGSLLVAVPLTVVVLGKRMGLAENPGQTLTTFYTLNEIGMLVVGLLLLSTGFLFQLRATTMVGSIMMVLFLLSLLFYFKLPDRLQSLAVYIMIGGGLFFGVGLLLALYRDRLITLPQRIKRREGIFKVLSWR